MNAKLESETETMMALRAHRRGGPEVLEYERAPKPSPASNEVLIAVTAAAITFTELNWDETWSRGGQSRLPTIPSHEFTGTVADVGEGVTKWSVGDTLFGLIPFDIDGAAAEYLAIDGSIVATAPQRATDVEAAAAPLAALTAWQAWVDHVKLKPGDSVLIHGAAGGVGIFAVQLAHHFGATVTVTARAADVDFLRDLGADRVIDFERERFEDEGPQFDAVLDPIGGEVLDRSFTVLRRGGHLVTLNAPPSASRAAEYGVTATFFIVEPNPAQLADIASLIDDGSLKVVISETFPLSQGRDAFESGSKHGRPPGKTVLRIV